MRVSDFWCKEYVRLNIPEEPLAMASADLLDLREAVREFLEALTRRNQFGEQQCDEAFARLKELVKDCS